MKKTIFYIEADDEELGQLDFRREFFENKVYQNLESTEHGFVKGKFRLKLEWLSEDDCDCTGFQHRSDCQHWEMCY